MGCKAAALFVLFNVIFFSCVSSYKQPPKRPYTKPPSVSRPPPPKKVDKCPKDTPKFGVCGRWLGLVYEIVGTPPSEECCTLIKGIADLEAAMCLCTAIKTNMLGVVKFEIPVAVSLLFSACQKKIPDGFKCA